MALQQRQKALVTAYRGSQILLRNQRIQQRRVHIKATPSTTSVDGVVDLSDQTQAIPKLSADGPFPADVQFEVLGAPYSMLSVALPANSTLYSRRGTLAGINGDVSQATSTLSVLSPTRAVFGIPFLYQKLTTPKPLTALVSTNQPHTTFGILQLDGKADWTITQRDALLAWAGHSISVRPTFSPKLQATNWGTSHLTGRGLVALIGRGQIYQATLQRGESFTVHPSSLLAYSSSSTTPRPPTPFRLPVTAFRLQVPKIASGLIPSLEISQQIRSSKAWQTVAEVVWKAKNWVQRSVFGERMFLKFEGPAVILLQSRAERLRDLVSVEEVGEWAVAKNGPLNVPARPTLAAQTAKLQEVVEEARGGAGKPNMGLDKAPAALAPEATEKPGAGKPREEVLAAGEEMRGTGPRRATTRKAVVINGKVQFEDSDFKEFIR